MVNRLKQCVTYSLKSEAYAAISLLHLTLSSVSSLHILACSISSFNLLFVRASLMFSLEHWSKCSITLRTACSKPSVSGMGTVLKSLTLTNVFGVRIGVFS